MIYSHLFQATKYGNMIKTSNKLDLLEKELGLNLDFDFDGGDETTATPTKEKVVESASPKKFKAGKGVIPTHWIITFFAGSLPASETAKLLDWSVFNGERYAGKCSSLIKMILVLKFDFISSFKPL